MTKLNQSLFALSVFALSTFGVLSFGEGAPTTASQTTVSVPSDSKVTGSADLRPTWGYKAGEIHTENYLSLGYQFNKNTAISYNHEIDTNIQTPGKTTSQFEVRSPEGYLRADLKNLWTDRAAGLSFHYQPRLYIPTSYDQRDGGMITAVRNYLILRKQIGAAVAINLIEIPIFHVYSQAGFGDKASPTYENRVYLVGEFALTKNLSLEVPVMFHSVRRASYKATAAFDNSWENRLWVYPELFYSLTPNVAVGATYQTDNLLGYDSLGVYQGFDFKNGFEKGAVQLGLRASL